MFTAAVCWSSGFAIGSLGVATDQLWLVYFGYGFVGGIGLGIGYISPVSTLIKWFPDRPGLATGLAIMGFGGGALIASPLSESLLSAYADKPEDAIVPAFLTLGALYLVAMSLGAFTIRVPADDWKPEGYTPPTAETAKSMQTTANVTAANAIRTPQFWLLWTVLFCNVTAGIGILEQASPMIQDFFPDIDAKEARGLRRPAVAGQHERALHLVLDVRRDRAQADLHGLPRDRGGPVLRPGLVGDRGASRSSSASRP